MPAFRDNVVDEEKVSNPFDVENWLSYFRRDDSKEESPDPRMSYAEAELLCRRWWTPGHEVIVDNFTDEDGDYTFETGGHIQAVSLEAINVTWIADNGQRKEHLFSRRSPNARPTYGQVLDVVKNGAEALVKYDFDEEKVHSDGRLEKVMFHRLKD